MQITGIITNFNKDWKTGKAIVTLLLDMADMEHIEKLSKLKKLTVTLKRFFKKRSLDSNAYMWNIAEKIAKKLGITKIEVYRDAIREVGQCEILPIRDEAVDTFINAWKHNGQGWLCEIIGKSKLEGYTNITAYYRFKCL